MQAVTVSKPRKIGQVFVIVFVFRVAGKNCYSNSYRLRELCVIQLHGFCLHIKTLTRAATGQQGPVIGDMRDDLDLVAIQEFRWRNGYRRNRSGNPGKCAGAQQRQSCRYLRETQAFHSHRNDCAKSQHCGRPSPHYKGTMPMSCQPYTEGECESGQCKRRTRLGLNRQAEELSTLKGEKTIALKGKCQRASRTMLSM